MGDNKNPKLAFCAANVTGLKVIDFVTQYPYPIEFVATCNHDNAYEDQIAKLCESRGIVTYRQVSTDDPTFIQNIHDKEIDLMMLAWWPDIVHPPAIDAAKIGWINMHPSLLPYNRGKHPYYWAINEGTPFGVTLHFIDKKTDTGDLLFQREIEVEITDTGESLYKKGLESILDLFKESYPKIVKLDFERRPQDDTVATYHRGKDLEPHSTINLSQMYSGIDIINRIRGRTFMNGDSAHIAYNGKTYRVKMVIEPTDQNQHT